MSGIVGHVMYAVLGAKAAAARRLAVAPVIEHHWASYLAGAYLGCDIQTMPEAVRTDTGEELGYGTAPLSKDESAGGPQRPYVLTAAGRGYSPRDIHERFYGRAHLTFGWSAAERDHTLPWDHLPDYCRAVLADALDLFGPGQRPLAYVLGWMTHLVGDGLIKSIAPGIKLHLLDGTYTSKNRPVQDLFTFHEVGRKELQLDWPALFADLSETPVEPVQLHYMRIAEPRGQLARECAEGWSPADEPLLRAVLAENRRYLRIYSRRVLADMELHETPTGWQCRPELSAAAGGLSYAEMVTAAEQAGLRRALWHIGESIARLFSDASAFIPALDNLPPSPGPSWSELRERWSVTQ